MRKTVIFIVILMGLLKSATYKIASYNVENLFDLEISGREYKQYIPGFSNWGLSTYMAKLRNTAKVISEINAEIIALQEIESPRALSDLKHKLSALGTKYKFSIFALDSTSTTSTAILSKFPIVNYSIIPILLDNNNRTRPILKAQIDLGGKPLTLFVVHWPSKLHNESFRVIAAKTVINQIKKLPEKTEYLILGDFNSDFDEGANILTEKSGNRYQVSGINHILKTGYITDSKLFKIASQDEVKGRMALLYNPWIDVKPSNQYSYIYKGEKNCIDNILIPNSLLDNKGLLYQNNSFKNNTLNNKLVRRGVPFRWQTSRNSNGVTNLGRGYSDHLPISLELTDIPNNNIKKHQYSKGSFELSQDGWLIQNSAFRAKRVKSTSLGGLFSLNIKGSSSKNGTIIKVISISQDNSPYFFIKGEGLVSIRYRNGSNNSWRYWKPTGTTSKSAMGSYKNLSKTWKRISLNSIKRSDKLEVQLRSKANSIINLYIDSSNINGWFRD